MEASNTTPRMALPEWTSANSVLRTDFNEAFANIDDLTTIARSGTAAVTSFDPTADEYTHSLYYQTTTGKLSWSDGTAWHTVLTQDSVSNGLSLSGNSISVNAGDGLGFSGSALKVNTGDTTDISGDAVIVKSGSLTQTQMSTGYRAIRVTGSAPASGSVAAGDVWTDTATSNKEALYVRTSGNTWQRPWNAPWGVVAKTEITSTGTQTISGGDPASPTTINISSTALSVTATLSADRLYKIRGYLPSVRHDVGSTRAIIMYLRGNGATYQTSSIVRASNATLGESMSVERIVAGISGGSQTWLIGISFDAVQFGNIFAAVNALTGAATITIEDIGPAI